MRFWVLCELDLYFSTRCQLWLCCFSRVHFKGREVIQARDVIVYQLFSLAQSQSNVLFLLQTILHWIWQQASGLILKVPYKKCLSFSVCFYDFIFSGMKLRLKVHFNLQVLLCVWVFFFPFFSFTKFEIKQIGWKSLWERYLLERGYSMRGGYVSSIDRVMQNSE